MAWAMSADASGHATSAAGITTTAPSGMSAASASRDATAAIADGSRATPAVVSRKGRSRSSTARSKSRF